MSLHFTSGNEKKKKKCSFTKKLYAVFGIKTLKSDIAKLFVVCYANDFSVKDSKYPSYLVTINGNQIRAIFITISQYKTFFTISISPLYASKNV